jgi:hypothetical protein
MLTGKRNVLTDICSDKDLPKSMEICEILPKTRDIFGGDGITVGNVTAVQECWETLDHFVRDMAMDGRNIDLYSINHYQAKTKKEERQTFINALESSPVHWLKPRPSGKRRRPGYAGTADILLLLARITNFSSPN